jgi:D-beta-D-heptose 7-phosphate kinase/D-beta-D-heptose 1-phosphate adenosyltransferase
MKPIVNDDYIPGKIIRHYDISYFAAWLKRTSQTLIVTSGGFDPIHIGHIRCIQGSSRLFPRGRLIVIVNGDGFLQRKKGKPFMNIEERLEIVAAIEGVDHVVEWADETQNVCGALEILKPDVFTKGGDRIPDNIPEWRTCIEHNIKMMFNVGNGGKVQSSSELIANAN